MRIAIVVSAFLVLSGASAFAENKPVSGPPAHHPAQHHPACAAAVEQFCKDVPFGDGRRLKCLAQHKPQLTPACQERLKIMQAMFEFGKSQQQKAAAFEAKQEAAEKKAAAGQTVPK